MTEQEFYRIFFSQRAPTKMVNIDEEKPNGSSAHPRREPKCLNQLG